MIELCVRFGIAHKTGYKWLARYWAGGPAGLADQSRASHTCPHRTAPKIAAVLVRGRQTHPHWGPKKLRPYLARTQPELALPAPSTAGVVLPGRGSGANVAAVLRESAGYGG